MQMGSRCPPCLPPAPSHNTHAGQVLHKSATVRHALKSQEAGADLIEIVGYEASIAGGQPGDEIGLWVALAKTVDLLHVPVPYMPMNMSPRIGVTVTDAQACVRPLMIIGDCQWRLCHWQATRRRHRHGTSLV